VLGRRLVDLFPVAFLPENHALAIAIMSYNGGIYFGLLADYDALPDVDVIADGIDESLHELTAAARRTNRRTASQTNGTGTNGGPAQILPRAGTRAQHGPAADMRAKRNRGAQSSRKRPPG
jgi:diacylglycerol O-acyltransferase